MAKSWKRTEVTIESETVVVLRSGATPLRAWCEGCEAASVMLTPDAAASIAGMTMQALYARVEAGLIHFTELPDGALLVCSASVDRNQT